MLFPHSAVCLPSTAAGQFVNPINVPSAQYHRHQAINLKSLRVNQTWFLHHELQYDDDSTAQVPIRRRVPCHLRQLPQEYHGFQYNAAVLLGFQSSEKMSWHAQAVLESTHLSHRLQKRFFSQRRK